MTTSTIETQGEQARAEKNIALGVYPTYLEAETAFGELRKSGFDVRRMSIVGRVFHADEFVVEYHTLAEYMDAWGKFLLIAQGTEDEITRAKVLLKPSRFQSAPGPA
jgi:hypothetical protein